MAVNAQAQRLRKPTSPSAAVSSRSTWPDWGAMSSHISSGVMSRPGGQITWSWYLRSNGTNRSRSPGDALVGAAASTLCFRSIVVAVALLPQPVISRSASKPLPHPLPQADAGVGPSHAKLSF